MSDEQQDYGGFDAPEPLEPQEAPEEAEEPQDAPEEGEEPEEQAEEPKRYAGKYETVEELERAYAEAQSKLGRLADQVGNQKPEMPPQRPAPDVTDDILKTPVSKLTTEVGAWDEWVAEQYGYDPAAMSEADWLEVKQDLKTAKRERETQERQQAVSMANFDRDLTASFEAQFPHYADNEVTLAGAREITAKLWLEVQNGTRPIPRDPEMFAKEIGELVEARVAALGPKAMGAFNARQAAQRAPGVPPGNVAPARTNRPSTDPNDYRGW